MRATLWMVGVLVLVGCRSSVDPDKGRFSCTTNDDCGTGWECRPQFSGGGRCFILGACSAVETCDGVDQNCDGRTDESFPEQDGGCSTGLLGVCATGVNACQSGALACAQTTKADVEKCNGLDDNCNGSVDETFDLTQDPMHCGSCARSCSSGTNCHASSCVETTCDDGVDNDSNGRVDCSDPSCFGLECRLSTVTPGHCGNLFPDAGAVDAGFDDAGVDAGDGRGCFGPEQACDNGLDDDGDGLVDCVDPDCDARTCFNGMTCSSRTCPGAG